MSIPQKSRHYRLSAKSMTYAAAAVICAAVTGGALAQAEPDATEGISLSELLAPAKPDLTKQPWLDPARRPEERADLALAQLTLEEKIQLMHGSGMFGSPASNGGVGYTPGIKRLGIPDLNFADSTVGVTGGARRGRYSTLMPSTIAEAASWDPQVAYDYAALVGRELRAQGYNVSLAGGANLARDPRNGRTFEYRGEDPLLTGKLAAQAIRGMQDQRVIGDLKHYALNDQETGRQSLNVLIDYRAARESDLLAFEIAVKEGAPGMVMCAYNRVWGDYSCENEELLNRTLKKEWGFKGWVVSDWGATHSAEKAMLAGLDMEQPGSKYFGEPLLAALRDGRLPEAVLNASVRRILHTIFALGIVDFPPQQQVVDIAAGLRLSQRIAEQGTVLLKNEGTLLPIAPDLRTIAIIGGHADVGVLTGGGSGQVDPPGGNAVRHEPSDVRIVNNDIVFPRIWWPSSPLTALKAAAPNTRFLYDDGRDRQRAAQLASSADMAIIFAYAPSSEHRDNPTLSLPDGQDALIEAVAEAGRRTAVILETSGPVTMPWIGKIDAVVAAWFPGAAGGEAIANLLLGKVNFSGKLPITFPRTETDLPHPIIQGSDAPMVPDRESIFPQLKLKTRAPFDVRYDEGALVGYKWFEAKGRKPLFAFGHGLSYTSFAYSQLETSADRVVFSVTNTGQREGVEIAQVYAALPRDARLVPRQLVGWTRIALAPGETQRVTVRFEPLAVSAFDVRLRKWRRPMGSYRVFVGGSSDKTDLMGEFRL